MVRSRKIAVTLIAVALIACVPPTEAVAPVAEFDLQCPRANLSYTQLNEKTIGVKGCGKQAKYVEICQSKKIGSYSSNAC
jgi:hypothetical protein